MARLALAAILVIVVVGAVAVFMAGLTSMRRAKGAGDAVDSREDSPMQKVSFFLLIALILYVSASGGA
jgi:NADH:ubiquinone oxidoreductase subunit 6 (subunit J)